jgi:1,4-alpha-glucan branching enzyme
MHDTLYYMGRDPIYRRHHHNNLTFRMLYAFHENFILPLSHDEVVHGKGSLLGRMPGDDWQKFANLRLLYGYMYGQAAKKLLFMGGEFGQWNEWNHDQSLDWHLVQYEPHGGVARWLADLNRLYRSEPSLYELDFTPAGFEWIDCNDTDQSVLSFIRRGRHHSEVILVVLNLTPVPRFGYRVGVPGGGTWSELLNSDAREYGGSGLGNSGRVDAEPRAMHGRPWSLGLTLPPLSALFFKGYIWT